MPSVPRTASDRPRSATRLRPHVRPSRLASLAVGRSIPPGPAQTGVPVRPRVHRSPATGRRVCASIARPPAETFAPGPGRDAIGLREVTLEREASAEVSAGARVDAGRAYPEPRLTDHARRPGCGLTFALRVSRHSQSADRIPPGPAQTGVPVRPRVHRSPATGRRVCASIARPPAETFAPGPGRDAIGLREVTLEREASAEVSAGARVDAGRAYTEPRLTDHARRHGCGLTFALRASRHSQSADRSLPARRKRVSQCGRVSTRTVRSGQRRHVSPDRVFLRRGQGTAIGRRASDARIGRTKARSEPCGRAWSVRSGS